MDSRYEAFCMASPLFYDALRSATNAGVSFPTADRPLRCPRKSAPHLKQVASVAIFRAKQCEHFIVVPLH